MLSVIDPKMLKTWKSPKSAEKLAFWERFFLNTYQVNIHAYTPKPPDLPINIEYASEALEKEGVHVVRNAEITEVTKSDKLNIKTEDGREIPADHVVVAVGVDIDHSIAEQSGLEYDSRRGGLIVNSELESRRDIYVAGDAANFYDQRLGRRRVEHYDHVNTSSI